jgi:hypothetical protein
MDATSEAFMNNPKQDTIIRQSSVKNRQLPAVGGAGRDMTEWAADQICVPSKAHWSLGIFIPTS